MLILCFGSVLFSVVGRLLVDLLGLLLWFIVMFTLRVIVVGGFMPFWFCFCCIWCLVCVCSFSFRLLLVGLVLVLLSDWFVMFCIWITIDLLLMLRFILRCFFLGLGVCYLISCLIVCWLFCVLGFRTVVCLNFELVVLVVVFWFILLSAVVCFD